MALTIKQTGWLARAAKQPCLELDPAASRPKNGQVKVAMKKPSPTPAPSGCLGATVETDFLRDDKPPFGKPWIWAAASEHPANCHALVLRSVNRPEAVTIYVLQNRTDSPVHKIKGGLDACIRQAIQMLPLGGMDKVSVSMPLRESMQKYKDEGLVTHTSAVLRLRTQVLADIQVISEKIELDEVRSLCVYVCE